MLRLFLCWVMFSQNVLAGNLPTSTVILVDKKTNRLHLAEYNDDAYKILKTYHATVGKVKGDKIDEDDLKTPEGVYGFTSHLKPPSIKPKFGVMAFYINYPNPYDKLAGRTGYDIMLHGTNEPERLVKDFDSDGCVVVKNEDLSELQSYIRLGLTPILIFPELTADYMHPTQDRRLTGFFQSWINAWEGKDIESYIKHYHSSFTSQGKDVAGWKAYKNSLNKQYAVIQVKPSHIHFFRHPKYSVIMFVQNYESKYKNGQTAFKAQGTKILYVAEERGEPRIIDESVTFYRW